MQKRSCLLPLDVSALNATRAAPRHMAEHCLKKEIARLHKCITATAIFCKTVFRNKFLYACTFTQNRESCPKQAMPSLAEYKLFFSHTLHRKVFFVCKQLYKRRLSSSRLDDTDHVSSTNRTAQFSYWKQLKKKKRLRSSRDFVHRCIALLPVEAFLFQRLGRLMHSFVVRWTFPFYIFS